PRRPRRDARPARRTPLRRARGVLHDSCVQLNLVQDVDPERECEQRRVRQHVVPGHAHAAQLLGAPQRGQVAAAQLAPLERRRRDRRLAENRALEEDVLQLRAVQIRLLHAAVAEDDALELREAEPGGGRQALGVMQAQPELQPVAATSGTTPIDGLAPLTQVGGDPAELLERAGPDVVLNATLGFAGLPATMWALERGVRLALANKESLVAAGELATSAHARGGGELIPVDSEHSALFQCSHLGEPESLVLTASGGPFRGRRRDELHDVTPDEALAHPTWSMGAKITIDSATLANKGLEVIEAHFLFGIPYHRIDVVIHPTSIVHGLVRFRDGTSIAHLGYPDMRVPISYALTFPERASTPIPPLDLTAGPLEFFEPDTDTFRLLALARMAGERGGTY